MIYLVDKRSQVVINKHIVDYINNNPTKKFIVIMSEAYQTRNLSERINRKCTRIGREVDNFGDINTYKINKAVLDKDEVIMLTYNYLPFFFKKMRDIAKEYTLFVVNEDKPIIKYKVHDIYKHAINITDCLTYKAEEFVEDGIHYCKIIVPHKFLEATMSANRSMLMTKNKTVRVLNYPKMVIESFENVFFCTTSSHEELIENFNKFKIEFELLK